MRTEDEIAVKIDGLTKKFGDFVAVDSISLTVRKGEVFGFLGPNGAGKSTTIKMLCGLLTPTEGTGSVGGYDVRNEAEEIKKHIGYMSQRFSLYETLTAEENIDFFSGIYGVPRDKKSERKDWALRMAGLEDRKNALTGTLPGGFKQRVALGCAILHEPPIIFLDEPTSGVDPVSRRSFWDLIYRMSAEGVTVFVTTHYMDEADYCDRLALIYRGRLIAEGTPQQLKEEYMVKDVLEIEVDDVVGAMETLKRRGIESVVFGSLLHVAVEKDPQGPAKLKEMLEQDGIPVNGIEQIPPSLEDVFVTLIEVS
ncbi:ABC transporter ATP-binding protein [Syntrophus aciditrophicus]|uniref:Export ABC transporter ATP-binding protein n=1 Tax=Syntrophus aciditrophicus (strain SB) TaxID=56780 RepID=Q2LXA5_SYNAS|nr:ABC transporter ATP-binding protein [Syntrophus aciditrophicus]ABC78717.1 export ABC transporter ATP-binding protein [Syntrophus aciditrophicus SB]